MSFTAIPTIDLSRADDLVARPALLANLRDALTDVGFLYVSHHGVPAATITDLVDALPPLFALPHTAKRAVALENSPHFLGYSGVGTETTAGRADVREQFEFATELPDLWRQGAPLSDRLVGPNQWPQWLQQPDVGGDVPDLRSAVEAYMAALAQLGERFLGLVAEALGLPPAAFLPYLSEQHRLKLVRYPGQGPDAVDSNDSSDTLQGVGPHKDSSGWWTFLLQASPPHIRGLQVLNKAGAWIDVPAVPGTLVVNIGQAFEVVTHGVCRATTHRVVLAAPGPGSGGRPPRFSVPFFQGVRRSLTKHDALEPLRSHFAALQQSIGTADRSESAEAAAIDSAFLKGPYDTWGEAQLRTKVRSHRENGRRFYGEKYEQYIHDT